MKTNSILILLCLILSGCVTGSEPKNTDEAEGIPVTEGVITDDEPVITLSRSKGVSYKNDPGDMISPYRMIAGHTGKPGSIPPVIVRAKFLTVTAVSVRMLFLSFAGAKRTTAEYYPVAQKKRFPVK